MSSLEYGIRIDKNHPKAPQTEYAWVGTDLASYVSKKNAIRFTTVKRARAALTEDWEIAVAIR